MCKLSYLLIVIGFIKYGSTFTPRRLLMCSAQSQLSTILSASVYNQPPFAPSTQPLQYIQAPILLEGIFDTFKDAAVPIDPDAAIAISIAETISGIVGGLASRGVADVLGDRKRDGAILKGFFTGAFFGVRSIIRGIATVIGLPRPIAVIFASFIASFVSEIIKVFGRVFSESDFSKTSTLNQGIILSVQISKQLREETISFSEVSGDISKWIMFDTLSSSVHTYLPNDNFIFQVFEFFIIGAISAIFGEFIRTLITSNKEHHPVLYNENYYKRLSQSALEGGILFSVYQIFQKILQQTIPDELGHHHFLFLDFLNNLENTADSVLL